LRKANYRFERAERDRAKKAKNDKKLQRQQERAVRAPRAVLPKRPRKTSRAKPDRRRYCIPTLLFYQADSGADPASGGTRILLGRDYMEAGQTSRTGDGGQCRLDRLPYRHGVLCGFPAASAIVPKASWITKLTAGFDLADERAVGEDQRRNGHCKSSLCSSCPITQLSFAIEVAKWIDPKVERIRR
jgi:hypothetical protein